MPSCAPQGSQVWEKASRTLDAKSCTPPRLWRSKACTHHPELRSRTCPWRTGPGDAQLHIPESPDRLWVADITYARSWEGWLYLAFVLDAFSRKVVGWSMANHLSPEMVLDALNNMGIHNRRPAPGLVHHSDRGSQYTSPWSLANVSKRQNF